MNRRAILIGLAAAVAGAWAGGCSDVRDEQLDLSSPRATLTELHRAVQQHDYSAMEACFEPAARPDCRRVLAQVRRYERAAQQARLAVAARFGEILSEEWWATGISALQHMWVWGWAGDDTDTPLDEMTLVTDDGGRAYLTAGDAHSPPVAEQDGRWYVTLGIDPEERKAGVDMLCAMFRQGADRMRHIVSDIERGAITDENVRAVLFEGAAPPGMHIPVPAGTDINVGGADTGTVGPPPLPTDGWCGTNDVLAAQAAEELLKTLDASREFAGKAVKILNDPESTPEQRAIARELLRNVKTLLGDCNYILDGLIRHHQEP